PAHGKISCWHLTPLSGSYNSRRPILTVWIHRRNRHATDASRSAPPPALDIRSSWSRQGCFPLGRAPGFYFAPIAAVLAARHFLVGAFLPDVSSVGHPSIARHPRLVLGFFVFRHFGFQVAVASTLRGLP